MRITTRQFVAGVVAVVIVVLLISAVGLLAAGTRVAGAWYAPPQPPTQEAAVAYLDTVVAIVQSRDLTGLCRLGGGTCHPITR